MKNDTIFPKGVQESLEKILPFCKTDAGELDLYRNRGSDTLYSAEAKPWREVKDFVAAPECAGSFIQRSNKMVRKQEEGCW